LDLPTRALAYYLHYHLQTVTDGAPNACGGLSECVTSWKASGRTSDMVDLALSTMALAVFGRTQRHPAAAVQASASYHRLLRLAGVRIGGADLTPSSLATTIDACLLTTFLMGRYEGTTYSPALWDADDPITALRSWSHHDGSMALLKIWADHHHHSGPVSSIITHTRRGVLKSYLLRSLALPDWLCDGARFGETDLEHDRVAVRTINLSHAASMVRRLTKPCLRAARARELEAEARDVDVAMKAQANTFYTNTSSYASHFLRELVAEPHPWPRRHFYSPTVHSCARHEHAARWSHSFAARVLVNSTRLKLIDLVRDNTLEGAAAAYEQCRKECVVILEGVADDLAAIVPFSLGRFKVDHTPSSARQTAITLTLDDDIRPFLASLAVWPLTIGSSVEGLDPKQQAWFRAELARLGRITGDGILECAETARWIR
jgi:hypothetical protein